jgi:Holliday junction resolvase-like predicted endonuclease
MDTYKKAELFVCRQYQYLGWSLLVHSYRGIGFEIDLIMNKNNCLVFIEVKYRKYIYHSSEFIENLMPYKKKQALQRGASSFISNNNDYNNFCFDLALVTKKKSGKLHAQIFPDINL